METKEIHYDKNQRNLQCYKNREKMESKLGCSNFLSCNMINLLVIFQLTMSGFAHLVVQPKTIKDMVYTPISGSPTISVIVYAHFGGSPKLNRNTIF